MEKRFKGLSIWAWRYRSSRRSAVEYLHFMATPESCDVLMQCLVELASTPGGGHRTMPLRELRVQDDPTGFRDSFYWFRRLRVGVIADDPELQQMSVSTEEDQAILAVHPSFVAKINDSLESVKRGGYDFAIRPETRKKSIGAGAHDRSSLALLFWQPLRGT